MTTTMISPTVTDDLRAALGDERAHAWRRSREPYEPTLRLARTAAGGLSAAVLTTRRPSTAAVKIVDVWFDDAAAAGALIDEVIEHSSARGDAAVKWELPLGSSLPDLAADRDFTMMRAPYPSAPGTRVAAGAVRWHRAYPHVEAPYYAQTTMYTCGAVAAMLATEHVGATGFAGESDDRDRDRELAFWRRASNFPACEPVGLAVAVREALADTLEVGVHLDSATPVLLEGYSGFEHDFRAELQRESRRQAETLAVPLMTDRIGIDEIVRRVSAGEVALLLIDEAPMHGETGPHWVLAHAARDGIVLIQDPWITSDQGETWVDTHDLPVAASDLDRMIAWGSEATRGVVFIGRAASPLSS